jgi:hypothetical protein
MEANCTHGACGTYGAYGVCGTCITYLDEKCGSFVADGTHVPYFQMVHISMDLPNEYKHVLKMGPKIK